MKNSPYFIGGRGQGRDFLQGCLTGLDESVKPFMTSSLAIFGAGKSSEGLNLLEHPALKKEHSCAGCHRKQSQTISKSINGEG